MTRPFEVTVGNGSVAHVLEADDPTRFAVVQIRSGGRAAGKVACGITGMLSAAPGDTRRCAHCERALENSE